MELLIDASEEFKIDDLILYNEENMERIAEINFIGEDDFGYYILSNNFTKIRFEKIINKL